MVRTKSTKEKESNKQSGIKNLARYDRSKPKKITQEQIDALKHKNKIYVVTLGRYLYVRLYPKTKLKIYQISDYGTQISIGNADKMPLAKAREIVEKYIDCQKRGKPFNFKKKREIIPPAARLVWSDQLVSELKPTKRPYLITLNRGLNVRVYDTGYKAYYIQLSLPGRKSAFRTIIAGTEQITLAQARACVAIARKAIKNGEARSAKKNINHYLQSLGIVTTPGGAPRVERTK